ncbi:response regulator transcription factor [Tuberibacillus sp. Marseille-P3662]|uniref:response regulator transcription factor n=1 Tax=Tuberibacillus sp. Marseille-P3662 TaxID=1965358 RepID=UPI00159383AA|nr:response regulator transcription factor [Tuberibacillus sp. Marseille-P3662]
MVVDDDPEIVNLVHIYLTNDGYNVIPVYNGNEALSVISHHRVDLVILDIMMPDIDGMEVCRKIRKDNVVPIIMLSAKTEDMDKIQGLMTGADDYMIKPFNPMELLARMKSLLRRFHLFTQQDGDNSSHKDDVVQINDLKINKDYHEVTYRDSLIDLTAKEFDILYLLANHPGKVYSAEDIFNLVWNEPNPSNNTVMAHISNLREKMERAAGYKMIKTVWGVGYKIDQ